MKSKKINENKNRKIKKIKNGKQNKNSRYFSLLGKNFRSWIYNAENNESVEFFVI